MRRAAVILFDGMLEPGSIFAGKYRIESTIGVGGMGTVLAAVHIGLDQRVALKVLQPELARHESLVKRFVREAKAVAKISGDHVVKVFDVGTSDGIPFIVLELLQGTDLSKLVEAHGPMLERDAVDSVIETCHAIAQAHAVGVVHRDLKPSNLFLATADDGSIAIKVLDFGISKLIETSDDDVKVTRTRDVFGSPLYMSPEQLRSSRDVDARSDIWSLGIVLFELLTASAPFDGESPMAVGGAILHAEPTPLRARRADASEGLEHVIATCLRKNPSDRYATAADLVNALAPFASSRGQRLVPKIARISERNLAETWTDTSEPRVSNPPGRSILSPMESAPTFLIARSRTSGNWASGAQRSGGRPRRALAVMATVFAAVAVVALVIFVAIRKPRVAPALASELTKSTSAPQPTSAPASSVGTTTTTNPPATDAVPSAVGPTASAATSATSSSSKPLRGRRPATASPATPRTTPTNAPVAAPTASNAVPAATVTAPDRVRDRHGMDE